ncbi:MAG: TonB family protein, partial [Paludibacter sp.]|nr:TonB family protein [Paludibacter sp.]
MEFVIYLIKVNIAIILFYLLYRIAFETDTFFMWKRIVLLFAILFSLFYPIGEYYSLLIAKVNMMKINDLYTFSLDNINVTHAISGKKFSISKILPVMLLAVYLAGVVFYLFSIVIQIFSILHIVKNSQKREVFGQKVYVSKQAQNPFSFFGVIVVNEKKYTESEFAEIMIHECTHKRQLHSIDVILGKILCVLSWFNPLAKKLEHEICLNLEFLADRQVLLSGCEPKHYQLNLMQLSYQRKIISLTNNFNVSFLKKRIIMMKKVESKSHVMLKYALLVPLIAYLAGINVKISAQNQSADLLVSAQSETTNSAVAQKQQPTTLPQPPKETIYQSVDVLPEFPGGRDALLKFISDNIKYPDEAVKKGIQEKITVRFVVNKDGSVSDVTVKGKNAELNAEAVRIIQLLPKF